MTEYISEADLFYNAARSKLIEAEAAIATIDGDIAELETQLVVARAKRDDWHRVKVMAEGALGRPALTHQEDSYEVQKPSAPDDPDDEEGEETGHRTGAASRQGPKLSTRKEGKT